MLDPRMVYKRIGAGDGGISPAASSTTFRTIQIHVERWDGPAEDLSGEGSWELGRFVGAGFDRSIGCTGGSSVVGGFDVRGVERRGDVETRLRLRELSIVLEEIGSPVLACVARLEERGDPNLPWRRSERLPRAKTLVANERIWW